MREARCRHRNNGNGFLPRSQQICNTDRNACTCPQWTRRRRASRGSKRKSAELGDTRKAIIKINGETEVKKFKSKGKKNSKSDLLYPGINISHCKNVCMFLTVPGPLLARAVRCWQGPQEVLRGRLLTSSKIHPLPAQPAAKGRFQNDSCFNTNHTGILSDNTTRYAVSKAVTF